MREDGNVIYGTFAGGLTARVEAGTEMLYQDDQACLLRLTVEVDGEVALVRHILLTAGDE